MADKDKSVAKKQKVIMVGAKFKSKVNRGREEIAGYGMMLLASNSRCAVRKT